MSEAANGAAAPATEDGLAETFGLAVYRPNPPGELLLAELERAGEGQSQLLVRFRRPSPVDLAVIEASARRNTADLLRGEASRDRYGLSGPELIDESVIAALAPLIAAAEAASLLWTDWNLGDLTGEGETRTAVKAPLTFDRIVDLLRGRPRAREAWAIHLDNASPLDRVEGNVFAVSPDTTMDGAANTAGDAQSGTPPAAGAGAVETAHSAPGSKTDP